MRSQSFKLKEHELQIEDHSNKSVSPLLVEKKQKTDLKLQKHQVNLVVLENQTD